MESGKMLIGIVLGISIAAMGTAFAQTVPNAPETPVCSMKNGESDCQFKKELSGTPTSVVGNRVIVFRLAKGGGHPTSRTYLDNAVKRLAERYKFTATVTEDPTIFTAANLANTKAVIMSNGDGDVIPQGANRTALENFNQVNGWGVIWIHAACAFITSGWPFGQNSCVQQYYHHDQSKTNRRFFLDSGTTASPNHGIKNPQSEFFLRKLPGWNGERTFATNDEYYCFQNPARNTAGVNVLLGYDRASGLPLDRNCPNATVATAAGSQNHNLAWTHPMGKGISIYNSMGHDEEIYTAGSNAGDSLLWRFIRYAAKDWEVATPTSFIPRTQDLIEPSVNAGTMSIAFRDPARNIVTISDVSGKRVFAKTFTGIDRAEIPNLKRGIYFVKVASNRKNEVKQIRIL